MRAACLLIALAWLLLARDAHAQPSGAADAACQGGRGLGVSRVLAVDSTHGPRFGHQQYKDNVILQDGEVVLTFDDGPLRPNTQAVIDALSAHCTRATFFMVGRMAAADPEMVREVYRRGHTIGTHTWTHKNLRTTNLAGARHEIELGFSLVQRAAGVPIAPFFRFPYLSDPKHSQDYLQTRNIGIFSIEVDGFDYRAQSGDAVHRAIMSQLKAQRKGILLFHDIQPSTAGGLRRILDDLKAQNFRVVHLVPKSQFTSLPAFDALADREFSKRKLAVVNQPMAPRAVTWPIAPPPAPPAVGAAASSFAARPPQVLPPPVPPSGYAPPPLVASPSPVERPAVRQPREKAWQDRVFEN